MTFFKECIFIDEKILVSMISLDEKKEGAGLFKFNGIVSLELCLLLKIPILPDFQSLVRAIS